ncbi:alpha/beta fold hydrolase [Winogradskya humida]|uniref:AB hydrolase-1 domain-containing protein n=1 Tax=Winogradskya humida TaxID=113566 RepID=A0ABQ3ZFX3_9ACTN|nr:alpha/beta hydrolase [Actinoplanes humidus]GIE17481.1 hypothetical protein Ahu01nite_005830 [Actinoplanes humidus]
MTVKRRWAPLTLALPAVLACGLAACSETPEAALPAPAASSVPVTSSAPGDPTVRMVSRDGRRLAFHVTPGKLPAIVLDAGGGEDSSYWKGLVPQISQATGSEVITYDRAGMGDSDEVPGAWDPVRAAGDLKAGLTQLGVTDDVVLVSHSQAGEVATYFVRENPGWVDGAVLVDANLPPFFTDAEVDRIVAVNGPQIEALKQQPSTRENRQLIATAENFGPVHKAYHKMSWPADVPKTVIVSEKTPFDGSPEDAQRWRAAAATFAEPGKAVTAERSSHDVPLDRPELVLDEIKQMAAR